MDEDWIPVEKAWLLNEKHNGMLQGLDKAETAAKYGDEQVHIWRRSYDVAPHDETEDGTGSAFADRRYDKVPQQFLPKTESLKDCIARVMPYWNCVIFPKLKEVDNIVVVAHGNSLRGIVKHLKGISDEAISSLNIPTATPYAFEFDDDLNFVKDYYLGDPEEIAKKQQAVSQPRQSQAISTEKFISCIGKNIQCYNKKGDAPKEPFRRKVFGASPFLLSAISQMLLGGYSYCFYIMYVRRTYLLCTAYVAYTNAARDLLIRRMRKSRAANEFRKAGRENKTSKS